MLNRSGDAAGKKLSFFFNSSNLKTKTKLGHEFKMEQQIKLNTTKPCKLHTQLYLAC